MIRKLSFILTGCVALISGAVAAAPGDGAIIKDLVVEDKSTAMVMRVAIDNADPDIEPKRVCSGDAIRIRLPGIASRGNDIEDIGVPSIGPWSRARVVPRRGSGSVVQIFARGSNMRVCERTTALNMGTEIVISSTLSSSEKARRDAAAAALLAPPPPKETDNKPSAPADENDGPNANGAEEGTPQDAANATENPPGAYSLFNKAAKPAGATDTAAAAGESEGLTRYAIGIALVLALAGVAWYYKRRKTSGLGKQHAIDILSSRRLGAKQQLLLVSVENTKLLLAVADKNVTTLSSIPPIGSDVPQMGAPAPAIEHAAHPLETALAEPQISPEAQFKKELGAALGTNVANIHAPRGGHINSNVEGLLAMARNRAIVERAATQVPRAEA